MFTSIKNKWNNARFSYSNASRSAGPAVVGGAAATIVGGVTTAVGAVVVGKCIAWSGLGLVLYGVGKGIHDGFKQGQTETA